MTLRGRMASRTFLAPTANAFAEDKLKCKEAGVDDFAPTPLFPTSCLQAFCAPWKARLAGKTAQPVSLTPDKRQYAAKSALTRW